MAMTQAERDAQDAQTLADSKSAHPKKYRDEKLYNDIVINGVTIEPNDLTQQRLIAARISAKEDAQYTVDWKTSAGFVTLNATQVIAFADAVNEHVKKCFAAEKTTTINLDSYATLEQIEGAFDAAYDAL